MHIYLGQAILDVFVLALGIFLFISSLEGSGTLGVMFVNLGSVSINAETYRGRLGTAYIAVRGMTEGRPCWHRSGYFWGL